MPDDGKIHVWDVESGKILARLRGPANPVRAWTIAPGGGYFLTGTYEGVVEVWEAALSKVSWESAAVAKISRLDGNPHWDTVEGNNFSSELTSTLPAIELPRGAEVTSLAVAADGQRLIFGSSDGEVRVWDIAASNYVQTISVGILPVLDIAITSYNTIYACSGNDVFVFDGRTGDLQDRLVGHQSPVLCLSQTSDGQIIITGSADKTVRLWSRGKCTATLEGHVAEVSCLATDQSGSLAVSGSADMTARLWDLQTGTCIAVLGEHANVISAVAITPDGQRAVSVSDKMIQVWQLEILRRLTEDQERVRYTNAKVLLVGESGVGKTALSLRLTSNTFEPTISTHGVWATQMKLPTEAGPNGTDREIWLWDFAGQADYRPIHQLFMDETALAVLVFNPQNDSPFEALSAWDRALTRSARRSFKKLLVAGRCDRGGLTLSRDAIARFQTMHNFAGYI